MRMIKFPLEVGMNSIEGLGLQLKYMDYQDRKLFGWFLEQGYTQSIYEVYVAITGKDVPDEYRYVTTVQAALAGGYYVLHAYD